MKILWLASWYPSRIEPFNGDFVQRHAEAASLYHDIAVFHVIKDPERKVTNNVAVEVRQKGRLTEHIIYYYSSFSGIPFLDKLRSEMKYRRLFKQQLKAYLKQNSRPDLVHLHVCMKAGVMALWLKRRYNLPYLVTEHATQFLPEDENTIYNRPFYFRNACRRVLQKAKAISAVSHYLGKAIQAFSGRTYTGLPNVVNTGIFLPGQKTNRSVCRFLHVSSLGYQKNPEIILEAIRLLKSTHSGFMLDIVGPENNSLQQKARIWELNDVVHFHSEMPQPALAVLMQGADALILFSRYETFGCVLIEANACGVPVIVNDLPVMRENVQDGVNGLLVQNTAKALAEAMQKFVEGAVSFSPKEIADDAAAQYSYAKAGEAFTRLYLENTESDQIKPC